LIAVAQGAPSYALAFDLCIIHSANGSAMMSLQHGLRSRTPLGTLQDGRHCPQAAYEPFRLRLGSRGCAGHSDKPLQTAPVDIMTFDFRFRIVVGVIANHASR
jgi:hypothetical protein